MKDQSIITDTKWYLMTFRVGLELVRDSQDKPDIVKDITLRGHVNRKIFNNNNNNDEKDEGNGTLMSNIQDIKGNKNIWIL